MGRPKSKQPNYYKSRGAYYCWHNGKQILCAVGPEGDKETVGRAFAKWFELQQEGVRGTRTDEMTIHAVLCCYLHWTKSNQKPRTYETRRRYAQDFINWCGKEVARELTVKTISASIVTAWAEKKGRGSRDGKSGARCDQWAPNCRRNAIATIKAALAFCVKMGHCVTNPLAGMPVPTRQARGGEALVNREQHEAIVSRVTSEARSKPLLHVIVALHATGCRPSEIANLTAKEVKEDGGVIFLDLSEWKTEGKHAFRHIFLTEELEKVVRMLRHQHPSGPLFRNLRGNAWTRHSIAARFDDLRRMLDLPDTITAYSYRHTFATEWLRAGKSIKLLAQLLGNSVGTIEKHYAHLLDDKAAMQAALRDFRR